MRWIVLALSLGTAIMSIIHGVLAILISPGAGAQSVTGVSAGGFTWITGTLLFVSAALALFGGIVSFNRRKSGGILLILAAVACFFIRDTRIYGGIYLLGGILSFFLRSPSSWDEYENEEEYEEDEEEYDDDDEPLDEEEKGKILDRQSSSKRGFRGFSFGGGRKEPGSVTSRISRDDRAEREIEIEQGDPFTQPLRRRSSKVCPVCGAGVGVGHRYCFVCGKPLHIPAEDSAALPEEDSFSVPSASPVPPEGEGTDFREAPIRYGRTRPGAAGAEDFERDDFEEENVGGDDGKGDDPEESEAGISFSGATEIASPHKVFVKPLKDGEPVPKRPLHISPDNSYQEFSHYTRRRKHRNRSLLRRIFGILVLLLAVGGVSWFLLSLRRVPGPLLIPDIRHDPLPLPPLDDQPSAIPDGPVAPDPLTALQIADPTRGIVVGTNVNIRADHSTAGSVVTRLNADVRVDILDRWEGTSGNLTGSWYQIRTGGREGWIYGQYFQPLDSRETSLPAGYTDALLKTFGPNRTELTQHLGSPTRQTPTALTWAGLTATLRGDNEVTRLQISSAQHVLQNGVAIGITGEALYRSVGYPSDYKGGQLRYLESTGRGMAVRMKDGKVQSVIVGNI
ncbi:MAG: SH3 domain-containing protein [Synergistaceae bacterium]|nr:SH3 domain-containing protein [Synergistaceae bacterium]